MFRRLPSRRSTDTVAAPPRHEPASSSAATAILVWHGMGQQVPFETIERVARSLVTYGRLQHQDQPVTAVRLVQLGEERAWRAEVQLKGADGHAHDVHIYEAYWAPLTQGTITLRETVLFLLNAGYQGIRHTATRPAAFQRFLFNRWVTFDLKRSLTLAYFGLLLALLALLVINGAIVMTVIVKPLTGLTSPDSWPTFALLRDLTIDFGILGLMLLVVGVAFAIAFESQRKNQLEGLPSTPHKIWQAVLWGLAILAVVVILAGGGLVAVQVWQHLFTDEAWWQFSIAWSSKLVLAIAAFIWLAVVAASIVIKGFLLEFVGDSAVYVWAHVLNRFFTTRQIIKQQSLATATAIYQFGGYRRHILMGHSLGSVIAYDTLNSLLNEEALRHTFAVRGRTALLLTFGSILDKTAFLFRTQTGRNDIREALASAAQPLISDATARPRWVNVFSPHDLFGGKLDFYDPSNGTSGRSADGVAPQTARPIENISDPDAWIPLLAHDQFWTNPALVKTLFTAVTEPGDLF